jgi:hypothetical protein
MSESSVLRHTELAQPSQKHSRHKASPIFSNIVSSKYFVHGKYHSVFPPRSFPLRYRYLLWLSNLSIRPIKRYFAPFLPVTLKEAEALDVAAAFESKAALAHWTKVDKVSLRQWAATRPGSKLNRLGALLEVPPVVVD